LRLPFRFSQPNTRTLSAAVFGNPQEVASIFNALQKMFIFMNSGTSI
jgi:hypothetical protein